MAAERQKCRDRGVELRLRQVRAHTEKRDFRDITECGPLARADALGNLQGDAVAGEAAKLLQLLEVLLRAALEGEALSCALMARFIAAEEKLAEEYGTDALAPRAARPRVAASTALMQKIRASGHLLRRQGRSLKCAKCGRSVGLSRLSGWRPRNPCPGQQIERQGRLCFALNPRKTAARYLKPPSACGGLGGEACGSAASGASGGSAAPGEGAVAPSEQGGGEAEDLGHLRPALGFDDPEHEGAGDREPSISAGEHGDACGGAEAARGAGERSARSGRRAARRVVPPPAVPPRASRAAAAGDAADRVAIQEGAGTRAEHLALGEMAALARSAEVTSLGGEVHATRKLLMHRGLRWCRLCGAYAFQRGRGLKAPCPGCPTPHGVVVLRRMSRSPPLAPPHTAWHDEA